MITKEDFHSPRKYYFFRFKTDQFVTLFSLVHKFKDRTDNLQGKIIVAFISFPTGLLNVRISCATKDHTFSTYAKFSEKLTFLTP